MKYSKDVLICIPLLIATSGFLFLNHQNKKRSELILSVIEEQVKLDSLKTDTYIKLYRSLDLCLDHINDMDQEFAKACYSMQINGKIFDRKMDSHD